MFNGNDVDNINQRRLVAGAALEQKNIDRLNESIGTKELGLYEHWTEPLEMIFKMRTELIDYITQHGLVDGLIWDGQLQPVSDRKIIITAEMIKKVTDEFGYLTEEMATTLIMQILTDGHYVQDEHYVHTDNNFTDPLKEKLENLPDDAEPNKVDDVTFNGSSIVKDKIAVLTITPADIKTWYESNPDTNALTDALLAIIESVPGIKEDLQAQITALAEKEAADIKKVEDDINNTFIELSGVIADLSQKEMNDIAHLDEKLSGEISNLAEKEAADIAKVESEIKDVDQKVDTNKGITDQQYAELNGKYNEIRDDRITAVNKTEVDGATKYTLQTAAGKQIAESIILPDTSKTISDAQVTQTQIPETIDGTVLYKDTFDFYKNGSIYSSGTSLISDSAEVVIKKVNQNADKIADNMTAIDGLEKKVVTNVKKTTDEAGKTTYELETGNGPLSEAIVIPPAPEFPDDLPRDGSKPMAGDLNMAGHNINAVRIAGIDTLEVMSEFVADGKTRVPTPAATNKTAIVNVDYVDKAIAGITPPTGDYLPLDGSKPMAGNLDMNHLSMNNVGMLHLNNEDSVAKEFELYPKGDELRIDATGAGTIQVFKGTEDQNNIITYAEMDMMNNMITGLPAPTNGADATNKDYVDGEIKKISPVEGGYLPLDGSKPMSGNLNMNAHNIDRAKTIELVSSSGARGGIMTGEAGGILFSDEVAGHAFLEMVFGASNMVAIYSNATVKLDEDSPLIVSRAPQDALDATNKRYVDQHIIAGNYIMANAYTDVNPDMTTWTFFKLNADTTLTSPNASINEDGKIALNSVGWYIITFRWLVDVMEGNNMVLQTQCYDDYKAEDMFTGSTYVPMPIGPALPFWDLQPHIVYYNEPGATTTLVPGCRTTQKASIQLNLDIIYLGLGTPNTNVPTVKKKKPKKGRR